MTIIIAGVIIILGISFGIGILFKNNGTITLATCANDTGNIRHFCCHEWHRLWISGI